MNSISAYPLQWPHGWRRTPVTERAYGNFKSQRRKITVADAIARLRSELTRMSVTDNDIVISTNARLRLDGLPRSNDEPNDVGAAVYWMDPRGNRQCLAIDQYHYLAQNIAALAATLEHMRGIERHGSAQILERAMSGLNALPAPGSSQSWRDILGFAASEFVSAQDVSNRFRRLANIAHPDKGGSHEAMTNLNRAYDEATKEISGT